MIFKDGVIVEVLGKKYRFEDYEELEWTYKDFKAEWGTYLDDAPPRSQAMVRSLGRVIEVRDLTED